MEEQIKAVMIKVSTALNDADVLWGLGASQMLYQHGLVEKTNDIDVVVAETDIEQALAALDQVALRIRIPETTAYATKHFHVFDCMGVSMDVMSGFVILHDEGIYRFPFDEQSITDMVLIEDVTVPLTSPEDWWVAYALMKGRDAKAEILYNYLMDNGVRHKALLERAQMQVLPDGLQKKLSRLLNR